MHPTFAKLLEGLHPKYERLVGMLPCKYGGLPRTMPKQGVYLFTERGIHLYVGRSNKMRSRYGRHCNPGATHRMAAFAFKLAREATGEMTASYKADEDSRSGLMLNPEFRAAFVAAKARIREMDFRFVEETDQNAQALLEIYCTLALNAKYNDFDTH
jgi:hypothetical protein